MLSSKNNPNNRSQIKIMSTEGHQRDFIISREREGFNASRGYSTLNSGNNVPASHTITNRGFENVVKIPNLLSNKNANHTIQNEFMGLRNSRGSNKNFEAGRSSALTVGRPGGLRFKQVNIITTGS
jgi:CTP synthase (UTP-ammonia lyase)